MTEQHLLKKKVKAKFSAVIIAIREASPFWGATKAITITSFRCQQH